MHADCAAPSAYVALYRRGTAWRADLPLGQQPALRDYIDGMRELWRRGRVELAGPFGPLGDRFESKLVGLVVLGDRESAQALATTDPAVRAGAMQVEILPWHR